VTWTRLEKGLAVSAAVIPIAAADSFAAAAREYHLQGWPASGQPGPRRERSHVGEISVSMCSAWLPAELPSCEYGGWCWYMGVGSVVLDW
jgi:hypothetical protein